jgi:hypothetical protein
MARRRRCRSNAHIEFAPAPGDSPFIVETNAQTATRDLKAGIRFVVADEKIRDSQRVRIKCAAERNAKLTKTNSPQVLDAR